MKRREPLKKRRSFSSNASILLAPVSLVGEITMLFLETIYWLGKDLAMLAVDTRSVIIQMARIGVDSLPIISITGFFTGAVLVAQIGFQFSNFGAESAVGGVVALALARELAPVLAAIVLAGRVGSAFAAEIGSMRVTEQVEALQTMAVSPINYLVVPRFLACLFMFPVLTIFTNFIGYFGGSLVAIWQVKITLLTFRSSVVDFLQVDDLIGGLIKAMVFGGIVSIIGCYRGFHTAGGAEGVGMSTTASVVTSIILILVSNYFLSVMLFNLTGGYV